jgi:hypothetical protein
MRFIFIILLSITSKLALAEATTSVVGGFGPDTRLTSAAGFYKLQIFELHTLKVTGHLGGRFSYFSGQELTYQTATTKDRNDSGVETLRISGTSHLALNTAIGFEVTGLPWGLGGGFNIDVLGYSYSPKKSVGGITMNGSSMNALRNAYNDIGTLYSEVFLSKRFEDSALGIKVGTTHSVTQYRAESDIPNYRTRRFLNFSDAYVLGVFHDY